MDKYVTIDEENVTRPEMLTVVTVASVNGLIWLCIGIGLGWMFWGG